MKQLEEFSPDEIVKLLSKPIRQNREPNPRSPRGKESLPGGRRGARAEVEVNLAQS